MLKFIKDKLTSIFNNCLLGVFSHAKIPLSIAIIMDGNRRYAQHKGVQKIKGHEEGLDKLLEVLEWCLKLGIKVVTVYAFSIDNFNRPQEEVDGIMNLAEEKFAKLSEKQALFQKQGIKVNFFGNFDFVEKKLKYILRKMEYDTKNNSNITLNVCFSYNFTDEFNRAIELYHQDKSSLNKLTLNQIGKFDNEDIMKIKEKFEKSLYGGDNCSPDILIRTSGENRLSNFLLYQCQFTMLCFENKLWPEFSFFDFVKIIIRYQINFHERYRNLEELALNNTIKDK